MNHSLLSPFPLRSPLNVVLFGLLASAAAGPAAAQLPWIGLAPETAELYVEEGPVLFGPQANDSFGFSFATGDFDGNGADDLATGVPFNDCDLEGTPDCGSVAVRYGWPGQGLTGVLHHFSQLVPGSPSLPVPNERFGHSLAVGDFDRDGRDDLVIGVPDNGTSATRIGGAQVHRGVEGGVEFGAVFVSFSSFPEWSTFGRAGWALAVGDFDNDGHDDLAMGAPWAYTGSSSVGKVAVARGHDAGLTPVDGITLVQGVDGLPGEAEAGDVFGYSLAVGDFNDDGFDDLAIGSPGEDGIGGVLVVYGSADSLDLHNPWNWYFGQADVGGEPETGDHFGEVLAAGDFDGDGIDDLAIGTPDENDAIGTVNCGAVTVLRGTEVGLTAAYAVSFDQSNLPGGELNNWEDRFGAALIAADFNRDGIDDLVVGTPGEGDEFPHSGSVTVILGTAGEGLTGAVRRLRPGSDPDWMIPDAGLGEPRYGTALATGDFDGNLSPDLAIGGPYRDSELVPFPNLPILNMGAVAVVYGDDGQLFSDGFESGDTAAWEATQ